MLINRCFFVLVSLTSLSTAQTITETFGTGANAFSIEFVQIGNPGNVADANGNPNPAGSVSYKYWIGQYEISREMVEKANNQTGVGITLADLTGYGGNSPNRPATGITWYEAAKFVNYLNVSNGSQAAYKFDQNGNLQFWTSSDSGYDSTNLLRNSLAKFVLPSSDEWYKSAYGSPSGAWYKYANGTDITPDSVYSGLSGLVYGKDIYYWIGPADITNAGESSPWGTMAQDGNAWEWMETAYDGVNDSLSEVGVIRGGSWWTGNIGSEKRDAPQRESDYNDIGFRVAMVPEPTSLSLLAIGLGGLAVVRRRRS